MDQRAVTSKQSDVAQSKCMIKNRLHTDMALHKNGLQQLAALPDSTREQPVAFATWSPDHRQVFNQVPPVLLLFFVF